MGVLSYSQTGEDALIADLLPATGHFLDIGAADGRTFSNTLALAERGWSGVCIEPAVRFVDKLAEVHRDHDVAVVCAAVDVTGGWRTLWDSADLVSTLDVDHRDVWPSAYRPLDVWAIPLDAIWDRYGLAFDFVSIDTEGSSMELARLLPVDRMPHLRVVCVERDEPTLALSGFETRHDTGNNLILIRNEEP
jgi:FkbM family methyltransferase